MAVTNNPGNLSVAALLVLGSGAANPNMVALQQMTNSMIGVVANQPSQEKVLETTPKVTPEPMPSRCSPSA